MTQNVTDTYLRTTTLSDGTVIAPAIPDPVKLRRDVMPNPLHSTTESTMAPTSEFARYFLLALPSRYVARSFTGAAFDSKAPNWLREPINRFLDKFVVNKMSKQINDVLATHELKGLDKTRDFNVTTVDELLDLPENQKLRDGVEKVLKRWSAGHEAESVVENAYKRNLKGKSLAVGSTATKNLRNAVRGHVGSALYGAVLGVGSMALTASYAGMVGKDIKNIYSEAVGFELNKRPEDVTFNDLRSSKNELVQQALENYWKKTAERALTDLPFFAAVRFPNLQLADLMIGVKGAQLFTESWRRRNTMLEDIVTLVNEKINPYNGLGQPINTAEIFDLYQHYHYHRKSDGDRTFNTIIERNTADSHVWAKSQRVFSRIADLMNQTYAYKHESQLDDSGQLNIRANFALPQFLYLLGNNMINPKDPEHTLAYIETANSYGMQAVKEVKEMFDLGMPVEAVIARFPVDRSLPSNQHLPQHHPFPQPTQAMQAAQTAPVNQLQQQADRSLEGRVQQALAQMNPSMA